MKYTKRILALLLATCMTFTSVQLPVNAEEDSVIETVAEDVAVEESADEESVTDESEVEESATEETETEESVEDAAAEEETEEESVEDDAVEETTDDLEEEEESEEAVVEESPEEDSAVEEPVVEESVTEGPQAEEPVAEESTTEEDIKDISVKEESVSYAAVNAVETDKEVVDAAIIFTDLHTNKSDYKDDTIQEIFGTLKGTDLPFSSVTSGGDAFSVNEDGSSSNGPYNGYTETINTSIRSALGDSDIPVNYVWSDHDRYVYQENDTDTTDDDTTLLDKTSRIVYGLGADGEPGTEDDGNYYVYALSMGDLSSDDRYNAGFESKRVEKGFTATVEQAIDNFETEVEELKTDRPLFIVSHQPLLARRGDNGYAADWCEAINKVAETRDVAYFFGHNHNYDKAADYYYEKGSEMPVAQKDGDKTGTNTLLNFAHMCAGYTAPGSTGSTSNTTRQGTVIVATVYEDSINYAAYNKAGLYSGNYAVNETVPRDHIVKTVTFEDNILTIKATSSGLTAINAENVTGEFSLEDCFTDYIAYDVELDGHTDGNEVFYSILFLDDMDGTGVELYHVDDAGNMTAIPYEMVTDELGRRYLEFATTYTGVFAYGAPGIPEGYTLSELKVSNVEKTTYFVGDSLDLVSPKVTAIYSKEGSEDFIRVVDIKDDFVTTDGYTVSGYDMTKAGKQTVVISYEGLTCSFDIEVFAKLFSDEKTGVSIELTVPGVSEFTVVESTNQHIESALKGLVKEGTIVAYDIVVKDYKTGDVVTVTMPIPDGIENPVVYYVSDSGKTAINMNATDNGNGTLSFDTDHFSTYVLGDGTSIELGNEVAEVESRIVTTTREVWVKVSKPVNGRDYLIANTGAAGTNGYIIGHNEAVKPSSGSLTVNGTTETYFENAKGIVWTASVSEKKASFKNTNGTYLGYTLQDWGYWRGYTLNVADSEKVEWTVGNGNLSLEPFNTYFYPCIEWNNDWIIDTNNWGGVPSEEQVYFYERTTVTENTGSEGGIYIVEGIDNTDAVAVDNQTIDLASKLYWQGESDNEPAEVPVHEWTTKYEIVTTKGNPDVIAKDEYGEYLVNGNSVTLSGTLGTAVIKVTYTLGDLTAWDEFAITTNPPHHYSIQLHKADMTVANITGFENGVTYYTYNSVTNTYHVADSYVEGTTYYTTPVIQGDEITDIVALKGIEAGDTYSVWAVVKAYVSAEDTVGIDMGSLGDKLNWSISDTSIADINTETGVITFTGNNYGAFDVTVSYEGDDEKVILDTITLSVTESLYIVPEDGTDDFPEYPNEGSIRFDKNATAVGNFSETGIAKVELSMTGVPYTTNNRLDVVLMLDRSSSMYKDGVKHRISSTVEATKAFIENIVMNEDDTFNNNRIMVMDFLGGNLKQGNQHQYESNLYTKNEENGYQVIDSQAELDALLTKITTDFKGQTSLYGTEYARGLEDCYNALAASKADGNKQFCVFMSDGIPNYMQGETTHFETTSEIVATFDVTAYNSNNAKASRKEEGYEYEKYSTLMKNEGVTVFTVGLGLLNTNSSWNNASKEACEQVANMLLNDISGPAYETTDQRDTGSAISKLNTYFFSVADDNAAAGMKNVFSGISQKILDAATEVVVEDKIGKDYTVNFSMPDKVGVYETDGISEFYIQAVEYQLNADKERTGNLTILENFTFNSDGTLKSHIVNDVPCDNCSHVTFTSNKITAISGTYFDYLSDDTGEYLTWENEKVSTTELALQYFVHLNNSSDAVSDANEIPPGTYYTNEYAKLTYTNHNGNRVQEEFPVPQMTWNGAQVSYVFYLVNEAGQPVNRAGKVIPFAEAVYVTDVQTQHVVWNDLEQSSALNANLLAEDIVPDVYALYDEGAFYKIHVYEDEKETNLNNHFAIGGVVVDDKGNTTTYVFNNKSDSIKYNGASVYIANDGNETNKSNDYLCKGEGTVTARISVATDVTAANFVNQPYFTEINGKYTLAENYKEDVTYYKIAEASYTPASGETQWKPNTGDRTSGGTVIKEYVYYIDENNQVYTIVQKKDGNEVREGFDFHNTTVAFAVKWKPELVEDTVVIDYGLDVVVDVIKNDGMAAGVVGVRQFAPPDVTKNSGTYEADAITSVNICIDADNDTEKSKELKIGTATVENMNAIRFTLDKTYGMQFNEPAEFFYEADVKYYNADNQPVSTSMYSSVTVIPATTVYYEDEFVDFKVFDKGANGWVENEDATWAVDGTTIKAVQDTDRPGINNISKIYDADNVYGYDSAYDNMSTHSLGSARKINVNENRYGTATFEFYGTGFDIISTTSNDTGTITVKVYKVEGEKSTRVRNMVVDTYYGYTRNSEDEWVVSNDARNSLYQIPVMGVEGLVYGKYRVEIKAAYNTVLDHKAEGSTQGENGKTEYEFSSYDLFIDAIRIYDPTGVVSGEITNKVVSDAYIADNEAWPEYLEVRNHLIDKKTFGTIATDPLAEAIPGAVYVENIETSEVSDYEKYGPNNEVYLQKGQAISFQLDFSKYTDVTITNIADIQIGLKGVSGVVSSKIYDARTTTLAKAEEKTISTATGMYYSIKDIKDGTITIYNSSENDVILSITDIKITFKSAPVYATATSSGYSLLKVSKAAVDTMFASFVEKPEILGVSTDKETYALESEVLVTVSTNDVVSSVQVNGTTITEFEQGKYGRLWRASVNAEESGELLITSVAYDDNGNVSQEDKTVVMIDKFAPKTFELSLNKSTVILGEKIKATVITSEDVNYVTISGKKVTKYTSDKTKGTRTWILELKPEKEGVCTIKVVAYNKDANTSNAISKTATVKKFAPKTFKLSLNKSTVIFGEKVKVTVTTSTDVKYVTISGKKVTKYTSDKTKGTRTWISELKPEKEGVCTIKVVAYNKDANASNAISKTATVKKFAPKTFKLSLDKSKVILGEKVKVTVTTSTDVKYVTISGKKVTKYTSNKAKGTRTWTLKIKPTKEGAQTIKVVSYNKNGSASSSISKIATVKKFVPETFKVVLNKSTVTKGNKYKVTVTTSTDVKYVKVNDKKITKYTTNKSKTKRTFEITYKAKTTGKKTVKVIAYNKNSLASNAISQIVTVKKNK